MSGPALMRSYVEFRDVHKAFGAQQVLRGLTLGIARGESTYIVGTSGVGKSVAIKHLVGLLAVDSGELWFDGNRIDQLSERDFYPVRRRVSLVFQNATLLDSLSLVENVALPLRFHRRLPAQDEIAQAHTLLAAVHLDAFANRLPSEVSDGVRKRAAIARAMTLEPNVLLLDEPTTGLDPISARRIDRLIREQVDRGVTCVVVSHDLTSIASADRVAFLYMGRLHAQGTPDELRSSPDPIVQQFLGGHAHGPMETPGF